MQLHSQLAEFVECGAGGGKNLADLYQVIALVINSRQIKFKRDLMKRTFDAEFMFVNYGILPKKFAFMASKDEATDGDENANNNKIQNSALDAHLAAHALVCEAQAYCYSI